MFDGTMRRLPDRRRLPLELPPPILTTDRLVLRTASAEDAADLAAYASDEREFHAPRGPRRPGEWYTEPFWIRRVEEDEAKRRADLGLSLLLTPRRNDGAAVLGRVNFSNVVRGAFHAAHLGFELRRAAEGRGLMHEALTAALAYAFGPWNLHRVMANHLPDNARSEKLLRRLGFEREGLAKAYLLIDGRWQDHVLNSLVNPDWIDGGR
jgi:ribosomal-protein-alanine N-acetyltransferase